MQGVPVSRCVVAMARVENFGAFGTAPVASARAEIDAMVRTETLGARVFEAVAEIERCEASLLELAGAHDGSNVEEDMLSCRYFLKGADKFLTAAVKFGFEAFPRHAFLHTVKSPRALMNYVLTALSSHRSKMNVVYADDLVSEDASVAAGDLVGRVEESSGRVRFNANVKPELQILLLREDVFAWEPIIYLLEHLDESMVRAEFAHYMFSGSYIYSRALGLFMDRKDFKAAVALGEESVDSWDGVEGAIPLRHIWHIFSVLNERGLGGVELEAPIFAISDDRTLREITPIERVAELEQAFEEHDVPYRHIIKILTSLSNTPFLRIKRTVRSPGEFIFEKLSGGKTLKSDGELVAIMLQRASVGSSDTFAEDFLSMAGAMHKKRRTLINVMWKALAWLIPAQIPARDSGGEVKSEVFTQYLDIFVDLYFVEYGIDWTLVGDDAMDVLHVKKNVIDRGKSGASDNVRRRRAKEFTDKVFGESVLRYFVFQSGIFIGHSGGYTGGGGIFDRMKALVSANDEKRGARMVEKDAPSEDVISDIQSYVHDKAVDKEADSSQTYAYEDDFFDDVEEM